MPKYKLFTVVGSVSYGIPFTKVRSYLYSVHSLYFTNVIKLLKSFVHVNGIVLTP